MESVEVMVIEAFMCKLVENILPQASNGLALQNRLILLPLVHTAAVRRAALIS